MPSEAEQTAILATDFALVLLIVGLCLCFDRKPEDAAAEGRPAQAQAAAAAVRTSTMTAAAPVVRLRYFPYSTAGRRASERLVCAICLEAFEHGEPCGEVPACRHFFHRACVDLWRKSSVTCPLCRCYMTATRALVGVSAADDMV